MRRTAMLCAVLALAVTAPAFAGDLTLNEQDATPMSEHAIGQPYWMLEAQCAGLYGATANFHTARHRDDRAEGDRQLGVNLLNDAIERLKADRRLDFQAALDLAGAQVDAGRAHSKVILAGGTGPHSKWNAERSFCLDVYEAYHHHS